MTKNRLHSREFANDIMAESLEEKIWNDMLALRKFERNLLKAEVLKEEDIKGSQELNADGSVRSEDDELRQRYGI